MSHYVYLILHENVDIKNHKHSSEKERIMNEQKEVEMKGIKVILLLGFFSILFACTKTEDEYPVVIEDIDGVKTITNPDYPKEGVIEYTLVEDLSIGGDVDDEDYVFHRP